MKYGKITLFSLSALLFAMPAQAVTSKCEEWYGILRKG